MVSKKCEKQLNPGHAETDKNKARIDKATQMMLDGERDNFEYKMMPSKLEMVNTTFIA